MDHIVNINHDSLVSHVKCKHAELSARKGAGGRGGGGGMWYLTQKRDGWNRNISYRCNLMTVKTIQISTCPNMVE